MVPRDDMPLPWRVVGNGRLDHMPAGLLHFGIAWSDDGLIFNVARGRPRHVVEALALDLCEQPARNVPFNLPSLSRGMGLLLIGDVTDLSIYEVLRCDGQRFTGTHWNVTIVQCKIQEVPSKAEFEICVANVYGVLKDFARHCSVGQTILKMDGTTFPHGLHNFHSINVGNSMLIQNTQHALGSAVEVWVHLPQLCIPRSHKKKQNLASGP